MSLYVYPPREGLVLTAQPMPATRGYLIEDARTNPHLKTTAVQGGTHEGSQVGDSIFTPRPIDFVRAEFAQVVANHPKRAELETMIGKDPVKLTIFSARIKLSLPQHSFLRHNQAPGVQMVGALMYAAMRPPVVELRIQLEVAGQTFDGSGFGNYNVDPLSNSFIDPASNAVRQLVESMIDTLTSTR